MKIIFSPSTIKDLLWFKQYYKTVFPEGGGKAKAQFLKIRQALLTHPQIGHTVEVGSVVREFVIPKTPYSVIYFIEGETIVVVRILDNRALNPEK